MSSFHKIVIQNLSSDTEQFYVFQQPAVIAANGTDQSVTSTSLGTGTLLPYDQSGTELVFKFDVEFLVGAYSNKTTASLTRIVLAPLVQSSLESSWPITLTPSTEGTEVDNCSNLSPQPLGLSKPAYQQGVPAGNFGIQVPTYTPSAGVDLFCGTAVKDDKGGITLSSYIIPPPVSSVFCAPIAKYYIKVGTEAAGNIITFSTGNAALCDFTTGFSTCNVSYNADGSFIVTGK